MIEIMGRQDIVETIEGNQVKRNSCIRHPETGKYYEKKNN